MHVPRRILPGASRSTSRPARPRRLAWVALFGTATLIVAASARADDATLLAQQADRMLRAAELREEMDATTVEFYRLASQQALTALQKDPKCADAHFVYFAATGRILLADGLTRNLLELRRLDREHLDRALELNPRHAGALAAKGGVLVDLPRLLGGDPDSGLELLRRANSLNPGGIGTRVSLAKALAMRGDIDEARRQALLAAHHACLFGRRKSLDAASEVLAELDPTFAKADH